MKKNALLLKNREYRQKAGKRQQKIDKKKEKKGKNRKRQKKTGKTAKRTGKKEKKQVKISLSGPAGQFEHEVNGYLRNYLTSKPIRISWLPYAALGAALLIEAIHIKLFSQN